MPRLHKFSEGHKIRRSTRLQNASTRSTAIASSPRQHQVVERSPELVVSEVASTTDASEIERDLEAQKTKAPLPPRVGCSQCPYCPRCCPKHPKHDFLKMWRKVCLPIVGTRWGFMNTVVELAKRRIKQYKTGRFASRLGKASTLVVIFLPTDEDPDPAIKIPEEYEVDLHDEFLEKLTTLVRSMRHLKNIQIHQPHRQLLFVWKMEEMVARVRPNVEVIEIRCNYYHP